MSDDTKTFLGTPISELGIGNIESFTRGDGADDPSVGDYALLPNVPLDGLVFVRTESAELRGSLAGERVRIFGRSLSGLFYREHTGAVFHFGVGERETLWCNSDLRTFSVTVLSYLSVVLDRRSRFLQNESEDQDLKYSSRLMTVYEQLEPRSRDRDTYWTRIFTDLEIGMHPIGHPLLGLLRGAS